jgi:hypothetical protein
MPLDQERATRELFNTKTLPQLIKELNAIDAEVWRIVPPTEIDRENGATWRDPSITNSTGERLHLRVGGYQNENKVSVSGAYGQLPDGMNWYVSGYMRGEHTDPRATMALTKTPKQLAADILRRVLQGGYRFYRSEYLKCLQEHTDRIAAVDANATRIEKASGGMFYRRPNYNGMNDIKKGSINLDSHGVRVGLKVSDSYVGIDWSGSVRQAEQIVKLLVEMGPEKEED